MKKKIALLMAVVMMFGMTVAGTLAWLIAEPQTVTNTFTVGEIEIELKETFNTDKDGDGENDAWEAQLIPGTVHAKDPSVAVIEPTNVDSWLFVQLDKVNNPDTYLTYTLNLEGWTEVPGETNAWYREVPKAQIGTAWYLLTGNTVTVKDTLTEDGMPNANALPQLVFKACAVQKDNRTVEQAWAIADPLLNPTNP